MKNIDNRKQENKTQSIANQVAQKQKKGNSNFHFVDNRPEATAQRKLQEVVNKSTRGVLQQKMSQGEGVQMKSNNGHPIQMKTYSVSRNLPLEPHFKETDANDTENLERDLIGKVREKYPLSAEDEETATREQWNAETRDAHRPNGFEEAKNKVMSQVQPYQDREGASASVWTRGAHVKGLSVASERSRANTPESTLTKKVTKINDWIGAHLVKREWGGEDNMWNVVSWPEAAEKDWGRGFEEPIDLAFAVEGRRELNIKIQVNKDDEAIPRGELDALLLRSAPETFNQVEGIPASTKSAAVEAWHKTNRGLESIPTLAKGESELGSATLNKANTKWNEAKGAAKNVLENSLKRAWNVHHRNPHSTNPDPDGLRAAGDREEERAKALDQERVNYRPERYDLLHNISSV